MFKRRLRKLIIMTLVTSLVATNSLVQVLYAADHEQEIEDDLVSVLQLDPVSEGTTDQMLKLEDITQTTADQDYEWTQYEGNWNISEGSYSVNPGGGYKIVAEEVAYTDFVYEADVTLRSGINADNAGLLFRVNEASNGADGVRGYYAGIGVDGKVEIGRMNNNWTSLAASFYPIDKNTTYRLKVVANGSQIDVYVNDYYVVSAVDSMFTSGSIGMRTWWADTKYSNLSVEDFQNQTDLEANKWEIYGNDIIINDTNPLWKTSGPYWMIADNSYKAKASRGSKIVKKDSSYTDFTYSADVSVAGGRDVGRNAGLIFRVSDAGEGPDNLKGYYAAVGKGNIQVGMFNNTPDAQAWTELKKVSYTIDEDIIYNLKLVVKESSIDIYIDNNFVTNVEDDTFTEGTIGMRTWLTNAKYSNVKIQPAEAPLDTSKFVWDTYEGNWNISDGAYSVNRGTGYKIVAKDVNVANFAYEADVSIAGGTDNNRNAGFIFRVTEPKNGADMLKGYYAGITRNGRVQVGRFNNNWTELAAIPYPITEGTKYRLKVITKGSSIDVYVDGNHVVSVADDMFKSGSVGMRTWLTDVTYSNVILTDLGEVIEPEYDWSWVKGAVFVPTNAVNQIQQWKEYDPVINDRELSYAHDYGFNLVRVYLHNLLWEHESEKLLANFEDFLQRADKYGIKVQVVFFDDCWDDYPDYNYDPAIAPRYGAHNSRWVEGPGDTYKAEYNNADGIMKKKMEDYVKGIVSAHLNDDRIAFWNTYNEPSNGEGGLMDQVTKQLMNDSRIWIKEIGSKIPVSATSGQFSGGPFSDFITWHPYEADYPVSIGGTRATVANKSTLADEVMNRWTQTVPGIVEHFYDKGIGFVLWELGIGRDNCRFPWGSDTNPLNYEPAEPFHGVVYPDGHPWSIDDIVAVRGNLDNLAVFNVQYFNDETFTDLKKTSITPRIDFDLGDERGTGSPDASVGIGEDHFSIRWMGTIKSKAAGEYTIYVESDNVARVWIGDTQVIEKSTHTMEEVSGKINLEAEKEYPIKVEYVHHTGDASMHLNWSGPSLDKTVLLPIYNPKGVTGVSVQKELMLNAGESQKLVANIEPADAFNQKVTWESDRPGIASVDDKGVVIGHVPGTATITVTTVNGGYKDTCTVTVNASTQFRNPIVQVSGGAGSADPSVVFKDGYYYYCKSDNDASLVVAKAKRLQDIGSVPRVTVFTPPSGTMYSKGIWAPELQYIQGKWYIYFAADDGNNANHRMYVLEGDTQDPQGSYTFKGKITDPTDRWAIDGVTLEKDDGSLYFVWSGWEGYTDGRQNLYIAPMSNPWTISGNRVQISTPTEPWEVNERPYINEGPEILKKDGKVFIVYSASGSWSDTYCLGMLTYTDGDDIMNPNSWTKTGPVFTPVPGAYGAAHNCFTVSPDGTEDWLVYHAGKVSKGSWANRSIRAQKFTWNADGTPNFGTPVGYGELIDQPSGTPEVIRYKYEAEYAILGGDAKIGTAGNASGEKVVGYLDKPGIDSILFNVHVEEAGDYTLTVMYGNGSDGGESQHLVSVNGGQGQVIKYKKYGWGNYNPSSIDVTLNKGSNSIKLEPKTYFAEVDYIVLDPIKNDDIGTPVQIESINLDKQNITLGKGQTAEITATVRPISGTNKNVVFTSTKGDVAAVSKLASNTVLGTTTLLVTAQDVGTTTIRVTSDADASKYAECTVTVVGDPAEPDLLGFEVDQFDSVALDSTWSVFQENQAKWSLTKNPGAMTISTSNTDIYQHNNTQDNVFLKTLDGNKDFEIVTKLTAPIRRNHEQAGLFVWQNADNLIKLAHVWVNGRTLETAYEIGQVYKSADNFAAHPGGDTVTLKIRKIGNIYTTFYWNGYEWIKAADSVTANLQNIKVGFFANSIVSNVSMDVKFDYFAYKELQGGIKLDKNNLTLKVGETVQITNQGASQEVIWTSSSSKIAEVGHTGLVTGIAPGRVTIKAISQDGIYSETALVTVTSTGAAPEVLYEEKFDGSAEGWATYGGTWQVSNGQYHVNSGAGYKALITDQVFTDYVLEADVKIKSGNEAGLIFRVSNPSVGADAFSGYYIGISAANKSATLGQMNNGVWNEIATKKLPINVGEIYRIKVIVNEGHIVVYINDNPLNVNAYPKFDVLEKTHFGTGQIGLRTFNAEASFDNVKISSYKEVVLEESYTNSVMPGIADPHVLYHEGVYYLYGTHTPDWPNMTRGIKVYTSTDLVNWKVKETDDGWALKNEDSWGNKQFWAPEVIEKNGVFYMYYAVEEHLAVATSDSPLGPFKQDVKKPIHDNVKEIDAHIFIDDDGKQYMYFVRFTDGNALWGAELNEDMMSIKQDTITQVFSVSQDWENSQKPPVARVNEGAFVVKHKGIYYMTYSGNHFESPDYGVGYATATSPLGPWTKYEYNPIMKSNSLVPGAGHHSLVYSPDGTELFMIYHAHNAVGVTEPRKLAIDRVQFVPQANGIDAMEVWGPTMTPQPMPSSGNTTPISIPVATVIVSGKDSVSTITTRGGALQMVATVTPDNATNKAVTWSIEAGSNYAAISASGLLTASANGTVVVKATSVSNPQVSNTCEVVITGNASSGGGGGGSSNTTPSPTPVVPPTPVLPSTPQNGQQTSQPQVTTVSISALSGTASQAGTNMELFVKPYIENGRTMAGVRDIANILQIESKNVVWNAKDKSVEISTQGMLIRLVIGQKYAVVNGQQVPLDVAPQVKEGRTVLPVAQIARLLNIDTQFDAKTKEITFTIKK